MGRDPKKLKEIAKLVEKIGVNNAAKQLNMKPKSVQRRLRDWRKMLADAWASLPNETPRNNAEDAFISAGKDTFSEDCVSVPNRYGMCPEEYLKDVSPEYREANPARRILVIGDIHAPFDYDPYFNHCISVYKKYECDKVVFIGDIIDNHYSSYHETDADGMGGKDELDMAINRLKRWYHAFPNADVIIGNHDRMVMRKAQSSSIPTVWIRDYIEVLGTPTWNFTDRVVYDNVQYIHGEGGPANTRMVKDLMSTVQGHLHTRAFVQWHIGNGYKVFGMQVGCGIDQDSYAMAYAKNCPKPAIACGVVLAGKVAISEVM